MPSQGTLTTPTYGTVTLHVLPERFSFTGPSPLSSSSMRRATTLPLRLRPLGSSLASSAVSAVAVSVVFDSSLFAVSDFAVSDFAASLPASGFASSS